MKTGSFLLPAFFIIALALQLQAQDQPTIMKDWVLVNAYTNGEYQGSYDTWSWVPRLSFRVNGPIESGGQLYAEFSTPGAATAWVKFDCATEPIGPGRWWKTECGGREIPVAKSTTAAGVTNFTIKMRNELAGTDVVLFKGRAKIGKVHSNEAGPKAVNKWVYYVDQDFNLPIGYVFFTPDDIDGWKKTRLNVAFWVRGDAYKMEPHLFYQGKEVGKVMYEGEEIGKPSCEAEVESETTHFVDDTVPQKAKWARVVCDFPSIFGIDSTGAEPGMFGPLYQLAAHPGEYEFKLLWNNHLARSIKFTVKSDGTTDSGIAIANKLGSKRAIVPVQIIGDQDGTWDKNAWKTDAFYGNPLTGFTALP